MASAPVRVYPVQVSTYYTLIRNWNWKSVLINDIDRHRLTPRLCLSISRYFKIHVLRKKCEAVLKKMQTCKTPKLVKKRLLIQCKNEGSRDMRAKTPDAETCETRRTFKESWFWCDKNVYYAENSDRKSNAQIVCRSQNTDGGTDDKRYYRTLPTDFTNMVNRFHRFPKTGFTNIFSSAECGSSPEVWE